TVVDGTITWVCRTNNIFIGDKGKTDFSDVHFVDASGSELPYFQESAGALQTKLIITPPTSILPSVGKWELTPISAIGDIDNDGYNEIVIGYSNQIQGGTPVEGVIAAYRQDGSLMWTTQLDSADAIHGLLIRDLDEDGVSEVIAAGRMVDLGVHM
ncbi:VCBS repeat-containing protein, partial [Escherichia coli]|uniref:FG-GAP repeat domain-containing protein n=1 Tax=Escherichia coli TaxID=562 RepID=UPI001BDC723B